MQLRLPLLIFSTYIQALCDQCPYPIHRPLSGVAFSSRQNYLQRLPKWENKAFIKMAVFDVILNDKITDLKDLLQADPKCANSVGWHGLTPLHHAALKNNEELIDLLLQYGANINHPNAYRETPLHLACQAASLKLVHKLLEIGADLRAEDSAGRTCIHHAAKSGSV